MAQIDFIMGCRVIKAGNIRETFFSHHNNNNDEFRHEISMGAKISE